MHCTALNQKNTKGFFHEVTRQQQPGITLCFAPVLARRDAELHAILHAAQMVESDRADGQDGVTDFIEISAELSLEVVDDAKGDLAAHDLEQVLAALHCLEDGSYGHFDRDLRQINTPPPAPDRV